MALLIAIRALALAIVIFLVDYFLPLGTSPFLLTASCSLGILTAGLAAQSRLKLLGFAVFLGSLVAVSVLLSKIVQTFAISLFSDPLLLHSLQLHASLALLSFMLGAISTWTVIRSVHGLSLEVLGIIFGSLYFFSGHRNFNFQSPQILGTLAWNLGYSPLAVLTSLGVILIVLTLLYLRICNGLQQQRINLNKHGNSNNLSQARIKSMLSAICIFCLFFIIGNSIFSRYKTEAALRTSNGVGQGKEENQSPLGFNSALGASNQPAALVRLDGDYADNPFTPMLYLRETALSKYNGIEMVAANQSLDRETAAVAPDTKYTASIEPDWDYRTPLLQSVFLLSDQKLAFAVDYPLTITPLKNPNAGRFKAAYKAYSMAPGFSKESLSNLQTGDPGWDPQTLQHYLQTSSDKRYQELAMKISSGFNTPVEKALALTNYLSEKAIYTLSPGHDIPQNGDQTAPFLFGDMRGYCVHFAHALVYMFRSIGIPARVGTGFLTDLSEARDGHILLRMSDRHAWAEIFIEKLGWVPFDPKPTQVESHAESPVDMKLLEELMGLVGPDEEILPADLSKGEAAFDEPSPWKLPSGNIFLIPLLLSVLTFLILKLHLWFAWILPASGTLRLKRLYRALVARVNDLGIIRQSAETRQEFRTRVSSTLGIDLLGITSTLNAAIYSDQLHTENLAALYQADINRLSSIPFLQKIKAAFNPASVFRYLSRSGW